MRALAIGLYALVLVVAGVSVAAACGVFTSVKIDPTQRPSLSRERVLLMHDEESGAQHFVREVVFERAKEPLGFVVPTVSRPTVEKVEGDVFQVLHQEYTFGGIGEAFGVGGMGLTGRGAESDRKQPAVEVLETKQIGSFKAFVLKATDGSALAKWLADNEFKPSKGGQAWLDHYVELEFFFVAMRYEPPNEAKDGKGVTSEVFRISFETPAPYYPYLEPDEGPPVGKKPRLMELWYVGREKMVPVALADGEWVRAMREGVTYTNEIAKLPGGLDALVPNGDVVVQTFQDQKRSRKGFGDVVFVPAKARELTPERRAKLEPLFKLLDPEVAR